jgi:MFS family permease
MASGSNPAEGRYPIAAAAIALLLAGVFIPSPLYELYHREWGLLPSQISIVFAIYVASLIPSLLFLGGISDGFGRRKTLLIAIAIAALGSLVFAFASGLWWLIAARILQGVAVGIGLPTAVAATREWMAESMRPRAGSVAIIGTSVGAGGGALVAGVLAQYAPLPNVLPFLLHIVLLAILAAAVASVPSCAHLAPASHQSLPTIPRAIRRPFYLASAESFIGWATLAIFASLLPSFLAQGLGIHNLLLGGFVVADVQLGMLVASLSGRGLSNRVAIIAAMLALGAGFWVLLLAAPYHIYALLAVAIFIAGVGNGLSYLAGLNIVNAIAPPEHRAETLSAFLVACYLGFGLPALGVGIAADYVGLYAAIVAGAIALGVLALMTIFVTTKRNLEAEPAYALNAK